MCMCLSMSRGVCGCVSACPSIMPTEMKVRGMVSADVASFIGLSMAQVPQQGSGEQEKQAKQKTGQENKGEWVSCYHDCTPSAWKASQPWSGVDQCFPEC